MLCAISSAVLVTIPPAGDGLGRDAQVECEGLIDLRPLPPLSFSVTFFISSIFSVIRMHLQTHHSTMHAVSGSFFFEISTISREHSSSTYRHYL